MNKPTVHAKKLDYYSGIRRNKLVTHGKTRMDYKQNYAQWKKPDIKDYIHSYEILKLAKFICGDGEHNSDSFWQQGGGEGHGETDWEVTHGNFLAWWKCLIVW